MSCPAATRAARARSAKSGVPAKTRRRKAGSGGLAQLLGESRPNPLLLQLGEGFNEHLALQMVQLVLDAHRKQPLGLECERGAVLIVSAHFHALRPFYELVNARQRETTFLDVGYAGRVDDLRVDQDHQAVAPLGDVDDDDLLVHIDLRSGEPDARGGIHRLSHLGHQFLQRIIEDGDRAGNLVKPCVGIAKYVQKRHRDGIGAVGDYFTCSLNRLYSQFHATYKLFGLVLNWGRKNKFQQNFSRSKKRLKGTVAMVQQLRKSITALAFFLVPLLGFAQSSEAPLKLKPDAPERYVVVPGDTLWGISQRYTDSPWRWPELWGLNRDEIRNPHVIYPGN